MKYKVISGTENDEAMDGMWGESMVKLRAENAERGELFNDGNYAMFIHWGIYSKLANQVDGETYYGIGEWIMHQFMADIPPEKYMDYAKDFNPDKFDAMAIARLARDAGMKYVIVTSKHHDGFAMYHSKSNPFNIVEASPYGRDPMRELAEACKEVGVGFGFYYSHNQDWTFPGGGGAGRADVGGGPKTDAEGKERDFEYYFRNKCLPQVKEITSEYGPIELVWFDTPGRISKKYVEELVAVVRENQPNALVSGRVGHGLGDYQTLDDMEVPNQNVEGMWETVDTTNDSWSFAWYDENWKTPKYILNRLVSCVARGGTYMLNIGPRGDGSVPERAADALIESGQWIRRYPQVVYKAEASPWKHALPWGDVTMSGNKLHLTVFEWPGGGKPLCLPGLKTGIKSAQLLTGNGPREIDYTNIKGWTCFAIPVLAPEKLASVIEVELEGAAEVDDTLALDPTMATEILAEFYQVEGAKKHSHRWMEKFGEWKQAMEVTEWENGGSASFELDVLEAGDYQVDLTYAGSGRIVWQVRVEGGQAIQNQQNSSHNYQSFPFGWLNFPEAGRYRISVSCLDGQRDKAALKAIRFDPVRG